MILKSWLEQVWVSSERGGNVLIESEFGDRIPLTVSEARELARILNEAANNACLSVKGKTE